ncbi:MAG: GNAT family N-acetyltransferase [Solirubrobacteraceae bacterium]
MPEVSVRFAVEADVERLYQLIVDLAEYERAPEAVVGTPGMLRKWLFGASPAAEALIAEVDGRTAGFALFHQTFSTWECAPGIWLEDLFVRQKERRAGVGEALLRRLAAVTVERGHTRLGWAVLDWNEMALGFYEKLGAELLGEWKLHRLSGASLTALAGR